MPSQVKIDLFEIEQIPHVRVAIFTGQVDESNLEQVKVKLDPLLLEDSVTYIILNFSQLTFINSKVIGYLTGLYSRLAESKKKLLFVECNESILDILTLVGLTRIIPNYPTLEEAVELVQSDAEQEN